MVKTSELPFTRRQSRNSGSGCHAVTKRYVVGIRVTVSRIANKRPPASRQNLSDPVNHAERGKPVLSRRFIRTEGRKASRKGRRWKAGMGSRSKRMPGCNDRDSRCVLSGNNITAAGNGADFRVVFHPKRFDNDAKNRNSSKT